MSGDVLLENLDDHRRLTQQVTRDLDAVRSAAHELGLAEIEARAEAVLERAHAQVFRVAVVGEFKRGKSTLINALLGREVLPADVLPCSATLNRVTYGLNPRVVLRFKQDAEGTSREQVIGIDELGDYVTKLTPESELRAADIEEAVVEYPVGYCRDKADIIDTPGLNDDQAMTQVTLGVLPEVDAALLVILAQSPFSAYEADFLNRLLTHDLGRVLFVVNRMDEIRRPRDRERVLEVVRTRIKKAVEARAAEVHGAGTPGYAEVMARLGEPRVFGVSGALALDGKLDDDPALLAESGFEAFEGALERFLTLERGLIALLGLADTTRATAVKVHQQVTIRAGAAQLETSRFDQVFAENEARLSALEQDYQAELRSIDQAATNLTETLRPVAQRLRARLLEGADQVLADYPLEASAISADNVEGTQKRMIQAVTKRLQTLSRAEAERTNREIEDALEVELRRLQGFSETLSEALRSIEFEFQPPEAEGGDNTVNFLAGGIAGALGGALLGGVIGGGVSGYRVAGVEGAAVGGATGVAVGFGTAVGLLTLASVIGLPLTWPVTLPALAISGLAAAFGGKAMVNTVFAKRRVDQFRAAFSEQVRAALEEQTRHQAAEMSQAISSQVDQAFQALRAHVEDELGGSLRSTERTLAELREQRLRDEGQRARDVARLHALEVQLRTIDTQTTALIDALRGTHVS